MKTAGIIGGIGPEATIEYYRRIITPYRELKANGSYPQIVIKGIDMKKMLNFEYSLLSVIGVLAMPNPHNLHD